MKTPSWLYRRGQILQHPCTWCARRYFVSELGLPTLVTSQVVDEGRWQTRRVAGESGYTRSKSLYGFRIDLWFSFWFMVFVWVYVCDYPLRLCYSYVLSFGCTVFLWTSFGFVIRLCSFGFGYKGIWNGRGEVCFTQSARDKLWWANAFLTTTTRLGRGEWWQVCADTGLMGMGWATATYG